TRIGRRVRRRRDGIIEGPALRRQRTGAAPPGAAAEVPGRPLPPATAKADRCEPTAGGARHARASRDPNRDQAPSRRHSPALVAKAYGVSELKRSMGFSPLPVRRERAG